MSDTIEITAIRELTHCELTEDEMDFVAGGWITCCMAAVAAAAKAYESQDKMGNFEVVS